MNNNINNQNSILNNNIVPTSNHPVDQISTNLDQETMEERVTQVIKVINNNVTN
jgi:hypothetical protein